MSGASHTPGPWVAEPGCTPRFWAVSPVNGGPDRGDICYLTLKPEQAEANARLIAAAPEMLEALDTYADQLCEGWCEKSPDCAHFADCAGCLARRTAWKARGEA